MWPDLGQNVTQPGGVRKVAIVQEQARVRMMRIGVEMIDPLRVERASAPNDPMDLIPTQLMGNLRGAIVDTRIDRRQLLHVLVRIGKPQNTAHQSDHNHDESINQGQAG